MLWIALFLPVGRYDILAIWAKHRKEVSAINVSRNYESQFLTLY